ARDHLFELRREQTEHGVLHVVDDLVDDLVGTDLDAFFVGELTRGPVWTHVEADDRGVGGGSQLDVALGDATDAAADERDLDVVALELLEALGERFERTVDVCRDEDVERGGLAGLDLLEDVLEPSAARHGVSVASKARHALPVLA